MYVSADLHSKNKLDFEFGEICRNVSFCFGFFFRGTRRCFSGDTSFTMQVMNGVN